MTALRLKASELTMSQLVQEVMYLHDVNKNTYAECIVWTCRRHGITGVKRDDLVHGVKEFVRAIK